jgi:hypothetical protein
LTPESESAGKSCWKRCPVGTNFRQSRPPATYQRERPPWAKTLVAFPFVLPNDSRPFSVRLRVVRLPDRKHHSFCLHSTDFDGDWNVTARQVVR